ncbi:4Fe-4S binding protein [Methanosarcina sp.]|uniref:nucleotide-binding protein n=1 Tax=Methanosarcina sp. TaxID=2213 RepID=UPI0029883243|nr:4Fe-4S binding protein [Methanosarcina sp.]MDW5548718.1 4Fe-4S binding protein [Methanosarcina sp.]MDW5553817.1 4Fe-4S binding protein [Methanosarcina sp.]MDW5558857.1 4Fe-4S binding protein [Methanosarcina sp.]
MKQLTVISGKGGTGKTTLTAAFASLAKNVVIADCDVDAADMHLILKPRVLEKEDYCGLEVARIDPDLCIECGKCREFCRYGAIDDNFEVDPYGCEGCAVCTIICPKGAVSMEKRVSGQVFSSETRFGPMAHARLGVGEEASGKLVSVVRSNAKKLAEQYHKDLIVIDGPPGTGCSAISAITGADLVLVVSEPTVSGVHDLKRVLELIVHFMIPTVVCINKYDINEENTQLIENFCAKLGISVIGKLPYNDVVTKAMLQEKTLIESVKSSECLNESEFADQICQIWTRVEKILMSIQD